MPDTTAQQLVVFSLGAAAYALPIGAVHELTIDDAAGLFGSRLLLVVLTGMGRDGLRGAEVVKAAGGTILLEAENTCTVCGMPRAIAEGRLADEILGLGDLPAASAREAA